MMERENVLCFDLETTGLGSDCEILQFSAVDGDGNAVLNEYFRPMADSWPEAEKINGISPEAVRGKYPFEAEVSDVQAMFDNADIITGYNIKAYDLPVLEKYGVNVSSEKVCDVMEMFVDYMAARDPDAKPRYKLKAAAEHFGYKAEGEYHDGLEDSMATLFVRNCLLDKTA